MVARLFIHLDMPFLIWQGLRCSRELVKAETRYAKKKADDDEVTLKVILLFDVDLRQALVASMLEPVRR